MMIRAHFRGGRRVALGILVTLLASSTASAFPLLCDYTGFTWSSLVGAQERLESVGVFDGFTPQVGDPEETYTYYMGNLLLVSEQDLGSGFYLRSYSGGTLSIYESNDPVNRPYDYGTNPVGGTPPPSFVDGDLWLGGTFDQFSMLIDTNRGIGSWSGTGVYSEGNFFPYLEEEDFFGFAGLTTSNEAGIPEGYEYRADGQVSATVAPVPEPGSLLLLGAGLVGAARVLRRKS